MHIQLKHKETGDLVEAKVGFSWTTLLFGCLTPLTRGDWKWALIMIPIALLTYGISHIVFGFCYNKIFIKEKLKQGYIPANDTSENVLLQKNYIVK